MISNTVILGLLIALFATIGAGTPVWLIVAQAFVFGFFTSLQYTSMNTLVYADVTEEQASSASTIASTMQQMSISFGIATASLVTAFFIPDRFHTSAPEMIHGIHQAFLVLGGLTVLSAIVFRELKNDDGDTRQPAHGHSPCRVMTRPCANDFSAGGCFINLPTASGPRPSISAHRARNGRGHTLEGSSLWG